VRIITSNSTHRERIRLRNRLRRARVSIPTADRKHRRLIDVNFLRFAILSLALLQLSIAVFETDMSPGEGRPVFEASSNELPLHELPLNIDYLQYRAEATCFVRMDGN